MCRIPLQNAHVFYPSKWKNALFFLLFAAVPIAMTMYLTSNGTPMTTAKWVIATVFYVGWVYYFWLFVTNRLLEIFIVSGQGIHIVPYSKNASIRCISWDDLASISKMINTSSKAISRIDLKLKSGEVYCLSPAIHDGNAIYDAIELYAPMI